MFVSTSEFRLCRSAPTVNHITLSMGKTNLGNFIRKYKSHANMLNKDSVVNSILTTSTCDQHSVIVVFAVIFPKLSHRLAVFARWLIQEILSWHVLQCQIYIIPVCRSSQKPSINAIKRHEEADRSCPERLLQKIIMCAHTHTLKDSSLPVGSGPHSL